MINLHLDLSWYLGMNIFIICFFVHLSVRRRYKSYATKIRPSWSCNLIITYTYWSNYASFPARLWPTKNNDWPIWTTSRRGRSLHQRSYKCNYSTFFHALRECFMHWAFWGVQILFCLRLHVASGTNQLELGNNVNTIIRQTASE